MQKNRQNSTDNDNIPIGLGLSNNPDAANNINNISKERKKKIITQYKQAVAPEQMGQLVDRIASHNFQ